jgi:diguanylate cyclase (GGDEF)-like protein
MAIRAILILGSIMLGCGSIGLLLVRMTSPLLRGLGFLSASFALGSIGSGLLLGAHFLPAFFSIVTADLCVLGSFTLLHITVLELFESESLLSVLSLALLGTQAGFDVLVLLLHGTGRTRTIAAGFLIGIQAIQTAAFLLSRARQRLRLPAIFVASLLVCLGFVNVWRSTALCLGFFRNNESFHALAGGIFAIFIAISLGLGFGVFWMSTTVLTTGLEQMASTDPLTRTFNRRVFLKWCDRERERNLRTSIPFSILMVDFDHFKHVNDTYGHQIGDELLCMAVEHMQNAIRGIDVLGRWGGEEFAVLLPGATGDAATLVAERLRGNVARMRMQVANALAKGFENKIKITVSVGIATFKDEEDDLQHMLKRADTALYEAKAQGRNRVVMSSVNQRLAIA